MQGAKPTWLELHSCMPSPSLRPPHLCSALITARACGELSMRFSFLRSTQGSRGALCLQFTARLHASCQAAASIHDFSFQPQAPRVATHLNRLARWKSPEASPPCGKCGDAQSAGGSVLVQVQRWKWAATGIRGRDVWAGPACSMAKPCCLSSHLGAGAHGALDVANAARPILLRAGRLAGRFHRAGRRRLDPVGAKGWADGG